MAFTLCSAHLLTQLTQTKRCDASAILLVAYNFFWDSLLTLGLRSMKTNVNSEHGKKVADIILLFIKLLKLFKIYE